MAVVCVIVLVWGAAVSKDALGAALGKASHSCISAASWSLQELCLAKW